jgi:hypothetical protein
MSDDYAVVESRVRADGSTRHTVNGPGGIIIVQEDKAGNLSGRLRSGYVVREVSEGEAIARALEAVRELRQGRNAAADKEAE